MGSFRNCSSCGIVWYTSYVLYVVIGNDLPHLIGYICRSVVSFNLFRYPHTYLCAFSDVL